MDCATKYPILLLHGMGFHDRLPIHYYWGRVPAALRKRGADVYFGNQDGNATIQYNAECLVPVIEGILKKTGAEKLNIIAHSKGGLEARYLISTLGMGEHIASVTTLCTPHNGSPTVEKLLGWFPHLIWFGSLVTDVYRKIAGDHKPQTFRVIEQLTVSFLKEFNAKNPDMPGIFYQSYAFVMKGWYSDLLMSFSNIIVNFFEGENDGFLPPANVRWTNFRGVYRSSGWMGISHPGATDYLRIPFSRKTPGEHEISDMTELYIHIVSDLKERGL